MQPLAPVTATAPGSTLITGEHAVIYGHAAIVCAIEQRATVKLHPLSARHLEVKSSVAPWFVSELDVLPSGGPLRFVLACVNRFLGRFEGGLSLEITSDIDPTLGLGSSAAVTIACLGALSAALGEPLHSDQKIRLHHEAVSIIRGIQGRGSGADLAASLFGGMLSYRISGQTADITALPVPPPLSLRYSGYKTPTGEVLARVAAAMVGQEAAYEALYSRMGALADMTITAAEAQDWPLFASHMQAYQDLMVELGVSDATLDQFVAEAARQPGVLAAKISGSGLGDCVLAMGATPESFWPAPVTQEGLKIYD
ncbi:MAG: hypothetical protein AAF590_06025 [Pseudomonadota bacterium]